MKKKQEDSSLDLELYRLDGGTLSLGCQPCPLLSICGGQNRVGGGMCETRCAGCDESCDLVCLGKPEQLVAAIREVGGFGFQDIGPLTGASPMLPPYIPMIHHGSMRSTPLETEWAAVPLSAVVRRPRGVATPVAVSPDELRREFKVGSRTKLVLIGTGQDKDIEQYWKWHTVRALPAALAALGWTAAVVPNYSFSLKHPRPQHMHNRKRSLICAREWSRAGIPTIPYLQAVSPQDWEYWYKFLDCHPEISVVAKEFRTGPARRHRGLVHLDELARLQDRLERPLHVVAISGAQYRGELAQRFQGRATIVDSRPFMRAVNWRIARQGEHRVYWDRASESAVEDLLAYNIDVWSRWLLAPFSTVNDRVRRGPKRAEDRRQFKLPLAS